MKIHETKTAYPARHPGITEMCPILVASCTPAKPGQENNEGDQVEHCCHDREDQLYFQKGEGQFHLKMRKLYQIEG